MMKEFFAKLFILRCLKDINESKKNELDSNYDDIRRDTIQQTNELNSLQSNKFDNLSFAAQLQLQAQSLIHGRLDDRLKNTLNNNDPYNETLELQTFLTKEANRAKLAEKTNRILEEQGQSNSNLVEAESSLKSTLAQNKILNNQLIDCINNNAAIEGELQKELSSKKLLTLDQIREKKGSLVQDYADTSTEMPSYMDPED